MDAPHRQCPRRDTQPVVAGWVCYGVAETVLDSDAPDRFAAETRKSYVEPDDTERTVYVVLEVVNGTENQVEDDDSLYSTTRDVSVPEGSVQLSAAPAIDVDT